jgi:DNA-binding transcriptional MocR family regulator
MGGLLKAKGLDVLRALLKRFYSYLTGECFPSYDQIAEAAGCARSTVAAKLRILEQLGIIETIRRKVVATFKSKAHRVRFDVAVQTSNSYRFNIPVCDRPAHGDLALPLLKPRQEAESELQSETSNQILDTLPPDLRAALEGLRQCIEGTDRDS